MAKPFRGRNAKKIPAWRGTCPKYGRTRVRVLWVTLVQGQESKVCKRCISRIRKGVE